MANVTPTSAAVFIPEVWANEVIKRLRSNIVLTRLITRDSDIASFQRGDILHIPFVGALSANDKASNATVTLQVPNDTEVQVTLNKHKEVTILVEDVTRAQSNYDLLETYTDPAAIALAEALERDVLALYSGFSGSIGTSGTDLDRADFALARKTLTDKKIPQSGRFAIISTKDEMSLTSDASLQNYFAFAKPETIAEGSIGRLEGFDIYPSQMVPVVNGTPNSTKNLFGTKQMGVLAIRSLPEPDPNSGVKSTVVRDEESGIVIRVLYSYNPNYLGMQMTFDILYGVGELRDEAGLVVLS